MFGPGECGKTVALVLFKVVENESPESFHVRETYLGVYLGRLLIGK